MIKCDKHNWEPWDSSKGILYCRNCNSRITKAELSFQEGQNKKTNIIIWIGIVTIITSIIIGLLK